MPCYRCHAQLPEHAAFCPRCGAAAQWRGNKLLILFVLGVAIAFGLVGTFIMRSSAASSPRHSIEIEPFGNATTPVPIPAQTPPVRFIEPGQRWQPQSNDDVVIEFDSKGMSPEQAEVLKRELAKAMREKSK